MTLGTLKRDEVEDESPRRIDNVRKLFWMTGGGEKERKEEEAPNLEPTCMFIPSEDLVRKVIRAIATFDGEPLHQVLRRFGF